MAEDTSEPIIEMTVDAIMRRWPATIRIFLDFKMRCVGCPIAGFHTLKEACRDHHLTSEQVVAALKAAVDGPAASGLGGIFGECKQAVRISQSDALPVAHD
jgi:hybrid cluster-associated redox disulfide protein